MTLTSDSPTCQIICRSYLAPDGPNINKCLNSLDCALYFFFFQDVPTGRIPLLIERTTPTLS